MIWASSTHKIVIDWDSNPTILENKIDNTISIDTQTLKSRLGEDHGTTDDRSPWEKYPLAHLRETFKPSSLQSVADQVIRHFIEDNYTKYVLQ